MKKIFLILILCFTGKSYIFCQDNLIPNNGFENHSSSLVTSAMCQYGWGKRNADLFDSHMIWWKVARHNAPNYTRTGVPDWINTSNWTSYLCVDKKVKPQAPKLQNGKTKNTLQSRI
jgi:hypothetical protein